ncbi:MAG: hypothetical protein J5803_06310, partial [Desulfovibrio sp.]|nr:hypothetical protein [Desulfovibrio sp.]
LVFQAPASNGIVVKQWVVDAERKTRCFTPKTGRSINVCTLQYKAFSDAKTIGAAESALVPKKLCTERESCTLYGIPP